MAGPYDDQQPLFGRESLFRKKLNQLRTSGHMGQMPTADSSHRSKEIEKGAYLDNVASTLAKSDQLELDKLTLLDALTEFFNHKTINRVLKDELKRAKRYKNPTTIVMLSIDNFAEINAKYGPIGTDSVLKGVAAFLMKQIRDVDIPARWDSTTFLVVCPQTDGPGVQVLANRIRDRIITERVSEVGQNWHVTVSMGLAAFPQNGGTSDELVRSAQTALAEAEQKGGNCYVLA